METTPSRLSSDKVNFPTVYYTHTVKYEIETSLDLVITRSSDKCGVPVSSELTLSFMHVSHMNMNYIKNIFPRIGETHNTKQ